MGGLFSFIQPQLAVKKSGSEPDSFIPPTFILKHFGTPCVKNFEELNLDKKYEGDKKILVYCTSKWLLECENGKFFNTGHQTSEIFLPMYHLDKAGFKFDIVTQDGGSVAIEEWTYQTAPSYQHHLRDMCTKVQGQLDRPGRTEDVPVGLEGYAAIFIPGGHGPLIEGHEDAAMGTLLRSAHAQSLPTLAICHGPSVLRSAALGGEFPYTGYKICVFPDKMDDSSPRLGYLPGKLRSQDKAEAKLKELGVEVVNKDMDDSVHIDRELVTGASPLAAQNFAQLCVTILIQKYV